MTGRQRGSWKEVDSAVIGAMRRKREGKLFTEHLP